MALISFFGLKINCRVLPVILQKSDSKQKHQGKTTVVDTKLENLQWSLLDSVSQSNQTLIQIYASTKGRTAVYQGVLAGEYGGGQLTKEEQLLHMNLLKLTFKNKIL